MVMSPRALRPALLAALLLLLGAHLPALAQSATPWSELAQQVEVLRTERGIPHIRAESLEAMGFALAWVQLEDYGEVVVRGLLEVRGEAALHWGPGSGRVEGDLLARRSHARAVERFPHLSPEVQAIYTGFAGGVNRYLELHPEDGPPGLTPTFTGADVAARDVTGPGWAVARRFAARLEGGGSGVATPAANEGDPDAHLPGWEPGSNTWALGPSRTTSGHAILMRNPHLSWTAGYYEAHVTVPGVLEFYGDFRIGGPFGIIGGWNRRLGWSTTNNGPELHDLYALIPHPHLPDHIEWEGEALPLTRVLETVSFRQGAGVGTETRERWESPVGPVIHRDGAYVYVLRSAGDGAWEVGEQFFRMMTAASLDEWKDAMRLQARNASNFTYADADGNIFYVWNAAHPVRPHPHGGDTLATVARGWDDVWTEIVPFDALPQLLNPPGGYLRNENDPFHHTNLNAVMDAGDFPPEYPAPQLRLRSRHSLELIHNDRRFSLEEVVELKHSMGMLLADRVLDDLLTALRAALQEGWDGAAPASEVAEALRLLEGWDRTAAADARGALLFAEWWEAYLAGGERAPASPASVGFPARAESLFAEPWRLDAPLATPRGLSHPARAVEAFDQTLPRLRERWGGWDLAWGDVHRARVGSTDLPVGGCDGLLGCFRVLWFNDDADGRRRVRGGDGWVSAVEFGPTPRAYTHLAYGQSIREGHPHSEDQLRDFMEGRMTPVAFTPEEVEAALLTRYRPGIRRRWAGGAEGGEAGVAPIILITGSTDGLGRETALRLAETGAHLIIHGRNEERGEALVAEIEANTPGSARFYRADLGSLDEVRGLADALLEDYDRLDVLVNNAGIWRGEREVSADGHELHFQVNYLSTFLLTHRLRPLLEAAPTPRVVNVASIAQQPIDFDNVMLEEGYSDGRAYAQSKLAQILFTVDLAVEWDPLGVRVTALHPATMMDTGMVLDRGAQPRASVQEGVEALLHQIVGEGMESGSYWNGLTPATPHAQARDAEARARLRALSVELTGVGK